MKVLLLAGADSIHSQRWVEALHGRGLAVTLVSQAPPGGWSVPVGVTYHQLPFRGEKGYFANVPSLRRILLKERPDLVNAHYASGYGTLAGLVRHRPTLLNVWGSDVYDFPYQSWAAGRVIRWNLRRAHRLASTSIVMAEQVRRLVPEISSVEVTPFGVEGSIFRPIPRDRAGGAITVGTVKTLDHKYGIDLLLRAFARLLDEHSCVPEGVRNRLRLLLVGDGPQRAALEADARTLGISGRTTFAGRVAHSQVPEWLNRLDVYVAASRLDSESFGVAVVEASACGVPVVVSDVGGLPEVVLAGRTGLVVPREDHEALASAIARLVVDPGLRRKLGTAGREHALRAYEWGACVDRMLEVYAGTVRDFPRT